MQNATSFTFYIDRTREYKCIQSNIHFRNWHLLLLLAECVRYTRIEANDNEATKQTSNAHSLMKHCMCMLQLRFVWTKGKQIKWFNANALCVSSHVVDYTCLSLYAHATHIHTQLYEFVRVHDVAASISLHIGQMWTCLFGYCSFSQTSQIRMLSCIAFSFHRVQAIELHLVAISWHNPFICSLCSSNIS